MKRPKKCKVFVSYSHHDEALVRPLAGLLGVASDDAVFLDVTSLRAGDLWEEKIFESLREASVFVLCWCCESQKSKNVAKEIAAALSEPGKRLVPVLFCQAPLPDELAKRQWMDLRGKVVHECPVPHIQNDASDRRVTIHTAEGPVSGILYGGYAVPVDKPHPSPASPPDKMPTMFFITEADDIARRARSYFEGLGAK